RCTTEALEESGGFAIAVFPSRRLGGEPWPTRSASWRQRSATVHRLLSLHDLVGDPVLVVEPADDLPRAGVVEAAVPRPQRVLLLSEAVESHVLQRQQVLPEAPPQLLPQHRHRGVPEGLA